MRCTTIAGRLPLIVLVTLLALAVTVLAFGCSRGGQDSGSTTSSTESDMAASGDIAAIVGEEIPVGSAVITVRAFEPTFNPVAPEQRVSEQPAPAPSGNESFYQAYVKVENKGSTPLRVDPDDFACAVGNSVVGIEPAWSGPPARSLLSSSSLDLLVTFKAKAGFEPMLLYSPSWYDGTIRVSPASTQTTRAT